MPTINVKARTRKRNRQPHTLKRPGARMKDRINPIPQSNNHVLYQILSMRTSNNTKLPIGDRQGQFLLNTTADDTPLDLSSTAGTALVFLSVAFLFFFLWVYYICCANAEAAARSLRGRRVLVQLRQSDLRRMTADAARPPPLPVLPVSSCVGSGGAVAMTDCVICLSEFDDKEEMVKVIPGCRHVFHPQCIDRWLVSHGSCPVCRCTELFASRGGDRCGGRSGGASGGGGEVVVVGVRTEEVAVVPRNGGGLHVESNMATSA